jgi:hypothetical protein
LSLCFNWAPCHEGGGIAPRILDLGTRRRWVFSFMSLPLYLQGKSPCYPLDRRLGGLQGRSGRSGVEKNSQPLSGMESPDHPALYHWATLLNYFSFYVHEDTIHETFKEGRRYLWSLIYALLQHVWISSQNVHWLHFNKHLSFNLFHHHHQSSSFSLEHRASTTFSSEAVAEVFIV